MATTNFNPSITRRIDPINGVCSFLSGIGALAGSVIKDHYLLASAGNGNGAGGAKPKLKAYDFGFPLISQEGMVIAAGEPQEEVRQYGKNCDEKGDNCKFNKTGDAVTLRLSLSKPAFGHYQIDVSGFAKYLFTRNPKSLTYKFMRTDVGDGWDKVEVGFAFDTVEIIQFKDEPFPRLALTSGDSSGAHVLWERLKKESFCKKEAGIFLNTGYEPLGNGWCRFERMEASLSDLLAEYIKKDATLAADYNAIRGISDPKEKLSRMRGIVEKMFGREYVAREECEDYDCWTKEDIDSMWTSVAGLLRGLNEYYLRKK